ncbi:hypothetical protein [Streptomyces sp. NPDC058326]|uniref:hypothetical protein n=1 Tax=Streptomyces sp. NPDC058326 TaxID=3346447 RepID=UPI0036E1C17E
MSFRCMGLRRHHPGRVLAAIGLMTGSFASATAGTAAADVVEPFGKRWGASLHGDFTTIGNTVMGCPAARCAAAAGGPSSGNGSFVSERVDAAGTGGGYGSSTGHVVIPAGAEVAYARLFWGGNDGTYTSPDGTPLRRCDLSGADVAPSPGDPTTTAPVLRVGSSPATPVSIDSMVADPAGTEGPHYYTGESDVTAAFAGVSGTDTPVAVGNVWAANGRGCVAGWSLTVVHRFPGPDPVRAPELRNVHVYGGHVLQRSASPATTVTVDGFHRSPGTVRAGVTAYGGDRKTPGDRLLAGGQNVTESRTDNFFVSEADGAVSPKPADNLSIDAKAFEVPAGAVPPGATSATLTFSTSGDSYLVSALAFSVPVYDPEITRTASPAIGRPQPTPTPSPTPTPTPTPEPPTPTPLVTSEPTAPAPPAPGPHGNAGDAGGGGNGENGGSMTETGGNGGNGGNGGSMAETGGNGERLWLLGALGLALAATGLVAKAAMRGRRD